MYFKVIRTAIFNTDNKKKKCSPNLKTKRNGSTYLSYMAI